MVNLTGMMPPALGGEQETPPPSYEPEMDLNKTQQFAGTIKGELGLSEDLMEEVEDYLKNPPPKPKQSPIDAAIDAGYLIAKKISKDKTKYLSGIAEYNPEGNKAIRGMFKNALGADPDWNPTEVAWCATFVSQVLSDLGADPLRSKDRYDRVRADKYKNYGSPVDIGNITEGDIVVLDFDGDGRGDHATFYVGDKDDINNNPDSPYISVLGGNQGDAVSIRDYAKENILAIRRITYNDIDYEFTKELARDNSDFNAFLKKEGEGFDIKSLEENPMSPSNTPMTSFDEGGLAENNNLDLARSYGVTVVDPEETDQTLKALGKAAVESIPGISTAATIRDIKEELEKEDPSLAKVGVLAASEVVGLVPGLGDAAQTMIRKGADKVTRIIKPAANREELLADAPENAQEVLGITEKQKEDWRNSKPKKKQVRTPQLQKGIEAYLDNEITYQEYLELADNFRPIVPIKEAPELPTTLDIVSSLKPKQVEKGIIGVTKEIEDGTRVASRLDINAYESFDTWVVSFHDGLNDSLSGASIGHGQVAVLENVNFKTNPQAAANIAKGKGKATIARIFGDYKNADPEAVHQMAKDILADPDSEWVQVGMNPYRHSFFYDKADGMPVTEASEVIQVGPLVLARNVKKVSRDDPQFSFLLNKNDPESIKNYNQGGPVMNEQMEMAFMQEGGIKDDGMKRDPVSGNEIPPGSMASEVRDDIPAMLSEGEYVVPADVLRFYGVNFFEGLRNKAKSGLQNMEANGRIGGEPLSPDQVQQNMSGQPQAGAPARMPVAANTGPYMAGQPQGLQQAQGMAQNFNPMNYGVVGGSTLGGGQQQESVTTFKTYVNAETGETKVLEYINGQLRNKSDEQYTVPPYYEFGSAALKKAQQAASQPTPTDNGGGGGSTPPPEPKDPNEWAKEITDPMAWANENLQGKATSVISTIQLGTSVARVNAMAIVAEAQGNKDLAEQLRGKAREFVAANPVLNSLPNAWIDGDKIADDIQKDPTITEQILGKSVKPTTLPKSAPKVSPQKEAATKAVSEYSSKKNDDDDGPQIVTQKSIDQTKEIMEKAADLEDATKNLERTTAKIEDIQSGKNTSGQVGFKSGGLMAKKAKKKK